MQTDTVLTDIASLAASLVAQKTLRSKAVLLGRLVPLIDQAVALGHKHEAIHSAIQSGGVDLTFGYYRNTLHRIRTRNATSPTPSTVQSPVHVSVGSQEPKPDQNHAGSQEPEPFHQRDEVESQSNSSLPDAQKSLKKADALVAETDFAAIARQLRRKQAK
jgi:hypothetical protein